jgi:hypothetical protein
VNLAGKQGVGTLKPEEKHVINKMLGFSRA